MAFAGEHGLGGESPPGAGEIELNGKANATKPGRIALFCASAVGYVDNPEALYARGLAWGFHQQGRQVRILEERRNPALLRTLEAVGSGASRHAFEAFPGLLIHSYEPRTGAPLMEWVSRELSLLDLAIAVDGLPDEVARWIANIDHPTLNRVFVSYRPDRLTSERAASLEIDRYDAIFASGQPAGAIDWRPISIAVADQDRQSLPAEYLPSIPENQLTQPVEAARTLEMGLHVDVRR